MLPGRTEPFRAITGSLNDPRKSGISWFSQLTPRELICWAHDANKVVTEAKPPPTFPSRYICIKVTDCSHGVFFSPQGI